MEQVTLLNNVLSPKTNERIITHLSNHHWYIAQDTYGEFERLKHIRSKNNPNFSLFTKDFDKEPINSPLNLYAEIIFDTVTTKLNLTSTYPQRILWNMYLPNSKGVPHPDYPDDNYYSIVYSLHQNDGGLMVENKFFPDISGQAKIFKSNLIHRGIGPKKERVRFNLNIVFAV